MKLGVSKIDITPADTLPLAGFGDRTGTFEEVKTRIYVRVFAFEQPSKDNNGMEKAILFLGDLLWWGTDQMSRLREAMQKNWSIDESRIMWCATHSHSGPQTSSHFPSIGKVDKPYLKWMEQQVINGVETAFSRLEPVRAEQGRGDCHIGINRRLIENGTVRMGPNPDGTVDHQLNVMRFVSSENQVAALLVHFTCHPTTTGDNILSSEYCGYAMEQLERELETGTDSPVVAGFLQGCCGDIRPNLSANGKFYRGDQKDVGRLGELLAASVRQVMDKPMQPLKDIPISGTKREISLPLQPHQANSSQPEWQQLLAEEPRRMEPYRTLEIIRIDLAENFSLMGMNGEMVAAYGLWIRQVSQDRCWPVGYCNGMIGYIPTAAQLSEGGYEATEFIYPFGMPAPYGPECEEIIREAIMTLISKR